MTTLEYYGHSCFRLSNETGWSGVFDPYEAGSVPGIELPYVEADDVFISHGHADHNAKDAVKFPILIHDNPYQVTELLTDHDDAGGTLRGKNTITILSREGEKIAHFGDLGRDLTAEEREALKGCDVMMIPCGGFFTIDAAQAKKIIQDLSPRLTVLMHYRTNESGYDVIASEEEVLKVIPEARHTGKHRIRTSEEEGIITMVPAKE
ncbi:MAG: MBL fold metallo-hydrolase [Solobacterium sp.]|nr:MBL fold metallo-hydrolase [Solobacterium sp.]